MCMHEGQFCPGRNCRCECMNCMADDDDYPFSQYGDVDGYDRNGAFDGNLVYSDSEGGM